MSDLEFIQQEIHKAIVAERIRLAEIIRIVGVRWNGPVLEFSSAVAQAMDAEEGKKDE